MTGTIGAALEREHRLIDDGIESFAGSDTTDVTERQRAGLVRAIALLRRHIYLEEEFLFPPLRAAGLIGPVLVMVREHQRMWSLLDSLEQQLDTGDAGPVCRELVTQLAAHNTKEERILYPQADQLLTAAELTELARNLSEGQLPDGWACRGIG